VYIRDEWELGRGVLLSTCPITEITELLPSGPAYAYWKKAIRALHRLQLKPVPIPRDSELNRETLGAEPTFHNKREPLPVIDRVHYPEIWMGDTVPVIISDRMKKGLDISRIGNCFDIARGEWWNQNQISIYIDRAGCTNPDLKGDLLEEWEDIKAELPASWRRGMNKPHKALKSGDIFADQAGTYYRRVRGGRAQELRLDVMGIPYSADVYHTTTQLGEQIPVTMWGPAVLGPARTTFPRPGGWEIRGKEGTTQVDLSEWAVRDSYARFTEIAENRPSCESNWTRYFPQEIPWKQIWESFLRPGIYTPHHYMTFFKALHRALPTNTRFEGTHKCRLGCGAREDFIHLYECKHIKPYWAAIVRILNSLKQGRYVLNKRLIFFTLKRVKGEDKVLNRHMRGLIWLAWKFAWQQLAEIGQVKEGMFDEEKAINGALRMHHTAVLAAIHDYRTKRQDVATGARKPGPVERQEAEQYRVAPFITLDGGVCRYTKEYEELLESAEIKLCEDVLSHDE
jgi:hypothetical protein